MRLRHLIKKNDGGVWGDDPTGINDTVVLRSTEQTVSGDWAITDPATRTLPRHEVQRKRLRFGDLVVTKSSGSSDHIGKASFVNKDIEEIGAVFSNFNQRIRLRNVDSARYIWYLLNSWIARQHYIINATSTSGLGNLNAAILGNLDVPISDPATQTAIAAFLDAETARIDALIEKKQRLQELTQEKEIATLERVVKGQDRADPMKDSGVEWIGHIPQHWLAPKFTQIARLESGHTPSRQHPEYWVPEECIIPWVSLADIWQVRREGRVYLEETAEKISALGLANSAARLLPANTVILSRTASVGFPAILAVPMATTQDFVNWICGPRILPEYLYLVLKSMRREFSRLMMGSTHQTIYMPDVRSFKTPLPPLEEQREIVKRLWSRLDDFRALTAKVQLSIDRLREFRAALITAAVTGQVDPAEWRRSGEGGRRMDQIKAEMTA